MAMMKQRVENENTAARKAPDNRAAYAASAWRAESINKSQSQAHLPGRIIDARSHGSQESIPSISANRGHQNPNHFRRKL